MTTFFLKHPVIAIVLNVMITMIGYLSYDSLSIREYPDVKLPIFTVSARYPNADISLMESSVTNPLEDELAGVSGIEDITSHTRAEHSHIKIKFREGTSQDKAMIDLRTAIGLASRNLPKDMKEPVLQEMDKEEGIPFMAVSIASQKMSLGEMNHYAATFLKNVFRSLPGVASVEVWEQPYTMQVTLDPKKMFAFGVNADDVYNALTQSNVSWPVGKFQDQISTTLDVKLLSVEDFSDTLIKKKKDSGLNVFLRDIAHIELKTDTKKFRTHVNGKPGFGLSINCSSDANPLEVSQHVHDQVKKLHLPEGMKLSIVLDQSHFIASSLSGIKSSIIEAVLLVLLIMFLFLRNIKLTLIPLVTIPISLLGSAIFLKAFGFSINTITLLGMILAVGLVVDDAIVMLENIARHKTKESSSQEAAYKGAHEIRFAIVAMTLTLVSVYAPLMLLKGAMGQIFKEFAVAVAGSVLVSGFTALTLSPLMCAWLLKKELAHVNYGEDYIKSFLSAQKQKILWSLPVVACSIFVLLKIIPQEVAPKEDRGLMGVYIPSIPGKDLDTLESYTSDLEHKLGALPEAEGTLTFMGEWGSSVCINLKDYKDRKRSCRDIIHDIEPDMMKIPSVDAWPWSIDSGLPGIKDHDGGDLKLTISTTDDYETLYWKAQKALKKIKEHFPSARHNLSFDTPNCKIHLNKNRMAELGITSSQIAKTIEIFFSGSRYLEFSKNGIRYPITLQGPIYPWTLNELYITNEKDLRISLGALATLEHTTTAQELKHHNQMRSLSLTTSLEKKDDLSSVLPKFLNIVNKQFPKDYKKEWGGIAKAYERSSWDMIFLFFTALIFIYAVLCIQFENFIDPCIVMLTVPFACLGGLLFLWIFNQSLNIFTHIGFVTLIGLITKHGILIVEFANQQKDIPISHAIYQATLLRLRPILMTTSAMILGSLPLVMRSGAGCEAQRALGCVLLGGLLLGTVLTIILLPKCYEWVKTRLA